jgi:2-keto-4-pentenoate hydratase/2-oxohepta-3-ene-1,7-dioic acid hydratase in catechol pathway
MRLLSYGKADDLRPGILVGNSIVDTAACLAEASITVPDAVLTNRGVVQLGPDQFQALAESAVGLSRSGARVGDVSEVPLGPPIPDPDKVICLGLNYRDHAAEAEMDVPTFPVLFPKFRNSLIGSGAVIDTPRDTDELDYEGELAVVIGSRCKDVGAEEALDYVAGYMPANDITARDLQILTSQWLPGKALDGFGPCGPSLVTADEVDDPQALQVVTRVNGETVQDDTTAAMIFKIDDTISRLSALLTLEPGDIIFTGTPSGVGAKRKPPRFLVDGDVVSVEVEGLGCLTNQIRG